MRACMLAWCHSDYIVGWYFFISSPHHPWFILESTRPRVVHYPNITHLSTCTGTSSCYPLSFLNNYILMSNANQTHIMMTGPTGIIKLWFTRFDYTSLIHP